MDARPSHADAKPSASYRDKSGICNLCPAASTGDRTFQADVEVEADLRPRRLLVPDALLSRTVPRELKVLAAVVQRLHEEQHIAVS